MNNSTCSFGGNSKQGFRQSLWQNPISVRFELRQSLEFCGFELWRGALAEIPLAGITPKPRVLCFGACSPTGGEGFCQSPLARSAVGPA